MKHAGSRPPAEAVVCIGEHGVGALAIIRSLGRRGIPVHAVSLRGSPEYASSSRYCASRTRIEKRSSLAKVLRQIAAGKASRPLLYVDNDPLLVALEPHAPSLRRLYRVVDPIDTARTLTDKWGQLIVAGQADIPVPRSWLPSDWTALEGIAHDGVRLIAKPLGLVRLSCKTIVTTTVGELAERLRDEGVGPSQVVIQEYIEGSDDSVYAAVCHRDRHGESRLFTCRKLRQTPVGAGVMAVGEVIDLPCVAEMTRRIADRLGLRGVLSTEFKYDARRKRHCFIEWNPRPAGFHSLGLQAGVDVPYLAYCDLTGAPLACATSPGKRRARWINMECEVANLAQRPSLLLSWRTWDFYVRGKQWAVYAIDDLTPFLCAVRRLATALSARIGQRMRRLTSGARLFARAKPLLARGST